MKYLRSCDTDGSNRELHMAFTAIILSILAFFILYDVLSRRNINKRLRFMIEDKWGKVPDYVPNGREAESFSSYFNNWIKDNSGKAYIDGITWNDLEMDKVFNKINNTMSTTGEEYLYSLLRCPIIEPAELLERNRMIGFFQQDDIKRKQIQYLLARLGKHRGIDVSDYFYNENSQYKHKLLYYLLAGILILSSSFMVIVDLEIGAAALALSLITNATVYYRIKNTIEYKLIPLGYIIQMISTANMLIKLDIPELGSYFDTLEKALSKVRKIARKGFSLMMKAQNPITEYAKSLLFAELIAFESCHNRAVRHKEEIRTIFETLGIIDSMISAASFRESVDLYCEPVLTSNMEGKIEISVQDIYHPLIKAPVTNTFSFSKPVLVTGSNASGKSTFLKAVAVNTILGQTIATCMAARFKLTGCMIYTSMALKDNLADNESYFIVELKSLKRIIDASLSGIPCLCVVDEVLRGTNTVERIAASSEVLSSLGRHCLCLAATHDIELATILEGTYANYHFREEVTKDNKVLFDYMLYKGRSNTKNALKLLKIIGYDSSIVSRAQARAEAFLKAGVWDKA